MHIMSSSPWLDMEAILGLYWIYSPTREPPILLLFVSINYLAMGASDVPSFFFPSFVRHSLTNHPKQTKTNQESPKFPNIETTKWSNFPNISWNKKLNTYYNERNISKKMKATQVLACSLSLPLIWERQTSQFKTKKLVSLYIGSHSRKLAKIVQNLHNINVIDHLIRLPHMSFPQISPHNFD